MSRNAPKTIFFSHGYGWIIRDNLGLLGPDNVFFFYPNDALLQCGNRARGETTACSPYASCVRATERNAENMVKPQDFKTIASGVNSRSQYSTRLTSVYRCEES